MKDRRTSERAELEILRVALKFIRHHHCAIDGGANVGHWSVAMAPHFDAVMAFEPVGFSYGAMRERIDVAKLHNVYPIPNAIYDSVCHLMMEHPKKRTASTSYFGKVVERGTAGAITAVPIDIMNMDECALIKLDLEGAELRGLIGARKTLARCRPVVIVECVERQLERYGDSGMDLHAFMLEQGYNVAAEQKPNRVYVPC